jgi:hypothetical protein
MSSEFVSQIRTVAQIPVRDILICIWSYNGLFTTFDPRACYVVLTTHTIAKIESNILQVCRRDHIQRVNLWRSGLFKWDQIMIDCNGDLSHSFGIWHRAASEYITDVLSRPSPFLHFDGRDVLEPGNAWGCKRCSLLNVVSSTSCRACLNTRPKNVTRAKVSFPGGAVDSKGGDGGATARRTGLAAALAKIEASKHQPPVLQFMVPDAPSDAVSISLQ